MYKDLTEFLTALDKKGEIKHVNNKVSTHLEISKYTDRESKKSRGGKALFFHHVEGSDFPVVTNIFGSPRRINMAMNVNDLNELGARVKEYIDFDPPKNLRQALQALPLAINLTKFFPRSFRGKTPPCQEIVLKGENVDLSKLPVLHCWPKDGGAFVTLPLVITRSLETGKRNMGMYRLQIFDKRTTGMHWHIHKDGSHYYNEYAKAGKTMPVAVAIGCDPATTYAATAPLPRGVDEIMLAGFIRKRPVAMAKCVTIDLEVPAEAEFVLEGYVNPGELRLEGPFGDHTGYYSLADDYPVFHVTAVTHRKNAIYNATLVGRPPMEDCYLAKATERLFLPMLQAVMPEVVDYRLPWEGVFHNIVIVSVEKEYPGHAQKLMHGLWGQGQMSFCKAIVVVDSSIDPHNDRQVLETLLHNLDLTTDLTFSKGVLDVLDHSSPFPTFGNKIGIDLTPRFKGEPPRTKGMPAAEPGDVQSVFQSVRKKIPEIESIRPLLEHIAPSTPRTCSVLAATLSNATHAVGQIVDTPELKPYNIVILFDKSIDLSDNSLLLWKIFNNVDPGRDLTFKCNRVVVNACIKGPEDGHDREWPEELTFDP